MKKGVCAVPLLGGGGGANHVDNCLAWDGEGGFFLFQPFWKPAFVHSNLMCQQKKGRCGGGVALSITG